MYGTTIFPKDKDDINMSQGDGLLNTMNDEGVDPSSLQSHKDINAETKDVFMQAGKYFSILMAVAVTCAMIALSSI